MSWFPEVSLTGFQEFIANVLKCGPVPIHVAVIMDGNRRFAKTHNIERKEGHLKGFDKLALTLQWCIEFGIKELTVYAFSIENFKRGEKEVEFLMKLAQEKFNNFIRDEEKLMKKGICVRVIGNLTLIPPELMATMAKVMSMTKNNKTVFMNIAIAYTSRDEITNAVKTVIDRIKSNQLTVDDVDQELISSCMYTSCSPDPDLLIRTSGEVRLSDFLLWQVSDTDICFREVLWPEVSVWNFMGLIFYYQRCCRERSRRRSVPRRKVWAGGNTCKNWWSLDSPNCTLF